MNKKNRNRMIVCIGLLAAVVAAGVWLVGGNPDAENESVDKVPVRKKAASPKVDSTKSRKDAETTSADAKLSPEKPVEKPKAAEPKKSDESQAGEKTTEADNPFPRYLEMFRNNPEALVQEYAKEAEADRVRQMEMRKKAIEELHLNAEQSVIFERALDDLRKAVVQQNKEEVALIQSGQLNEDSAADGCIWNSNLIAVKRHIAARESLVQEVSEGLYEQLVVEGVSDADKQKILSRCTYMTSFDFETLEPYLDVYDKVYKNMGVGDGVFSWCQRQMRKAK